MANLDLMLEVGKSNLSSKARAVLTCLAMHCNKDSTSCFPSIKTISRETGISKSTVIRAIKELVEFNIVKKEARFSVNKNGGQTSNMYYLNTNLNKVQLDEKETEEQPKELLEEIDLETSGAEESKFQEDKECQYTYHDCVSDSETKLCTNPALICMNITQKENTS